MEYIELEETGSTNTWASENRRQLSSPTLVRALRQSAGRGQRGNSWESEPGKNLTVSIFFRPIDYQASRQFLLSEAIALGVCDTLRPHGINAKVKWPNDIYVADRKIAGILIEHSVTGRNITETVAGIGLNVNQAVFVSDAPNPVSMAQLSQHTFALDELCRQLGANIERRLRKPQDAALHSEYMSNLWRGDGRFYPFATPDGEQFAAAITDVGDDGMLSLTDSSGEERRFSFKEVSFLL